MRCFRRRFLFSHLLACAALLLAQGLALAAPLRVVVPNYDERYDHSTYFARLLRLALEKTSDTDGPFEMVHVDVGLTSLRKNAELRNNGLINVMWDSNDAQREAELLPIKISLLRNLHNYRVLLIRAEDRERFARIRSLGELRKLKAGAGVNWPSLDVLRANRMPVITSGKYEFLFQMLRAKRFDYMMRGIHAGYAEEREYSHEALAVEPTLLLHYPGQFYFFTSKTNGALADRITRGLQIAIKDGSFDKLYNGVADFRRADDEIKSGARRVLQLRRP